MKRTPSKPATRRRQPTPAEFEEAVVGLLQVVTLAEAAAEVRLARAAQGEGLARVAQAAEPLGRPASTAGDRAPSLPDSPT